MGFFNKKKDEKKDEATEVKADDGTKGEKDSGSADKDGKKVEKAGETCEFC